MYFPLSLSVVLYIITQNDKILFSFINNYRVKWYFSSISSQNPRNICIVGIDSNELLHSRYERHLQLTVFHEDLLSLQFELQPTKSIISTPEVYLQQRELKYDIDNLESCFDDLRTTKGLAEAYLQSENGTYDDVQDFLSHINQIYQEFIEAISTMNKREGPDKVTACLKTYEGSLDGRNVPGKFGYKWKQILSGKVGNVFN